MDDHVDENLEEWGNSRTPRVDGAFANRLEASLRTQMLDDQAQTTRRWASFVFRPAFVVLAIAAVVVGLAFIPRGDDGVGVADGDDAPTTSVVPTTSSRIDDESPDKTVDEPSSTTEVMPSTESTEPAAVDTTQPPETTVIPDSTESDRTTVPETTVPATVDSPTTVPVDSSVTLELVRTDRRVTATWVVRGDIDRVVGWVLIAYIDGDGEIVASSRDQAARMLSAQLSDLSQTFQVEGRDRTGSVVVTSNEVSLSRDG